jgi:anthranilate phosphoribosyltransferase
VGFLFAPKHHSAMKHAVGPRKELGLRTLFNLLGPLTNPADAPRQILGVFGAEWVEPIAHVLAQLGSEHVMVVHSDDGLDEISIGAPTRVAELKDGEVNTWPIIPEELGVSRQDLDSVRVDGPEESLAVIRKALAGEPGPAFDMVALNGGAAIYVAGKASSLAEGVDMARGVLSDGSAATTLESLVALTQRLGEGA